MGRRKTLAEELAELANPAPTRDPEAEDGLGGGAVLDESEDELATSDAHASRRAPEGVLLRRGVVELGDSAETYRGHTTTRAAAFGEQSDGMDEEGSTGSDDGEGASTGSGSDGGMDGFAGQAGGCSEEQWGLQGVGHSEGKFGVTDGAGVASDEGAAGGRNWAEGDGVGYDRIADGGMPLYKQQDDPQYSALEAQYDALVKQDEAAAGALAARRGRERAKGRAVAAQQALWERLLQLRILLQRGLAGGNRLPEADVHAALLASSEALRSGFGRLRSSCVGVVQGFGVLQDSLLQAHPPVGAAEQAAGVQPGVKRSREEDLEGGCDALWADVSAGWHEVAPFVDASLDRWHRKALLQGGAAVKAAGLRALNQSVSQQVSLLMADPMRLIKRTRLPRGAAAKLCSAAQRAATERTAEAAGNAADAGGTAAVEDTELDAESYDDADFYGALLREFLESSNADGAAALVAAQRTKKRKQVDRKASKGRKVRFHVHDKLVNFVAAQPQSEPTFAAQLFSNLFGKGGSATAVAGAEAEA